MVGVRQTDDLRVVAQTKIDDAIIIKLLNYLTITLNMNNKITLRYYIFRILNKIFSFI